MSWVQHWNYSGSGFGHPSLISCGIECTDFIFVKRFDSPPPLSWQEGFDPKDWIPEETTQATDYLKENQ